MKKLPAHEILTLEEVAAYLRVSERTVADWAAKGDIPCGKLGATWRFKRDELARWVDVKLNATSRRRADGLSLASVLSPERVLVLEEQCKAEALDRLISCLAETPEVSDPEELAQAMHARERIMSTGMGRGLAVPHVRLLSVSDIVAAVGVCRTPLRDYAALDDEPVQVICMVAARHDQHAAYLQVLAHMSACMKDPLRHARMLAAREGETIYRLLAGETPLQRAKE